MMPGFELPSDGTKKNIPVSEFEAGSEIPVELKRGRVEKAGEESEEKLRLKPKRVPDWKSEPRS